MFTEFFSTFKSLLDREVNNPSLATWLLDFDGNYSVLGLGKGVSSYQISKWLSHTDPLGRVRNRVAECPIKDLIEYFRKDVVFYQDGVRCTATTKDPSIVIETFTKIILQDKDLPKTTKENLLQYADPDTLPEFLVSLFFFSVTERIPLVPDILTPNIPRCLPQKLWLPRKKQENALQKLLDDGAKEIFIIGEGGLGKTEFITGFISKKRPPYRFYFTTFKGTIRDTILQLDFPDWETEMFDPKTNQTITKPVSQQYEEKLQILKKFSPKSVLVIDNFDGDSEELLNDLCLKDLEGLSIRLIFTTRMPLLHKDHIEITKFTTKELLKLMRLHLGELFEDEDLESIIEQVDHHTLLVDLIARLLCDSLIDTTPKGVITALQAQKWECLEETVSGEYNRDSSAKTILGHLLTLFNVTQLSTDACYVLSCATLLPVEGMNSKLFLHCLGLDKKWLDTVRKLQKSGWIITNRQSTRLALHPLVREACLQTKATTPNWTHTKPFITNALVYSGEPSSYQTALQLMGVLRQICLTITPDNVYLDFTAEIYLKTGYLYELLGNYQSAYEFINLACILRDKLLDIKDNNIQNNAIRAKVHLAGIQQRLGHYSEALQMFREILVLRQRYYQREDHPSLSSDHNNLAGALLDMGYYEECIHHGLVALELEAKVDKPDPSSQGIVYGKLSTAYGRLNDYEKMLAYAKKAVDSMKSLTSPPITRVIPTYGKMSAALRDNNMYEEALDYAKKMLQLCQRELPSDHPLLAEAYARLTDSYQGLGEYEKALENIERKISICEKVLPKNHPDKGYAYFRKGIILFKNARYQEAKLYFVRAQEVFENTFGSEEYPEKQNCYKAIALTDEMLDSE